MPLALVEQQARRQVFYGRVPCNEETGQTSAGDASLKGGLRPHFVRFEGSTDDIVKADKSELTNVDIITSQRFLATKNRPRHPVEIPGKLPGISTGSRISWSIPVKYNTFQRSLLFRLRRQF